MNTITQDEANKRVEQYIRDAVAAVSPTARLEPESSHQAMACSDPSDHGPAGRVIASRGYWLRDIPKEKNTEYINALVQWWKDHEFAILNDDRPADTYVLARHKGDEFDMSIRATVDDTQQLSLGATSPCVWPNGTPDPKPGTAG